jgi:hypothetical protein
LRGSR